MISLGCSRRPLFILTLLLAIISIITTLPDRWMICVDDEKGMIMSIEAVV